MMWATAVFVSKRGTWIVAQEYDEWIVFELVGDEGSIQICDEIRGRWNAKGGGQKAFFKRTAVSRPPESRSRKQNSGAVMRTREAAGSSIRSSCSGCMCRSFRTDSV